MTIILVGSAMFVVGAMFGMVLMAAMAAAGEASRIEEQRLGSRLPSAAANPAAAAGAENAAAQISDRLVRDFYTVKDDQGVEHVVPIEAPPTERRAPW